MIAEACEVARRPVSIYTRDIYVGTAVALTETERQRWLLAPCVRLSTLAQRQQTTTSAMSIAFTSPRSWRPCVAALLGI